MSTAADFISCEWDEDGLHLRVDTDDGLFDLRLGDPVEFYRAVRVSCDEWIAEMEAARREHVTGRADDPTQQAVLDRIKFRSGLDEKPDGRRFFACDDPEDEWMREQADLANKAAKENR